MSTGTAEPKIEARKFSEAGEKELAWLLTRFPTKRAALLPALRIAEREFGSVDWGAMKLVADKLELTPAYVWSVFSFYTHYRRPTDGKYVIEVCRTLPCALRGADGFAAYCSKKLGIKPGETTPDGKFTLKDAECQAACDLAPVLQVNALYHELMNPEKFDKLLEALP
ncbi:MAG TPA: NAD(P)H-dependent oxidoreductase subunit E [Planctomycetota bacterium]|nr:NAD(P)H-dependent oxidoreductase subunit E [Planctomycetota bacterium]